MVPLSVLNFGRLLLKRRLMAQVFRKKQFPDTSAGSVRCTRGEEDCFCLFFECQLFFFFEEREGKAPKMVSPSVIDIMT